MKRLAILLQLLFPLCAIAQNLTNGNYIVVLQDGVDPQAFARGQGVNPHHLYPTIPGFSGFFTSNRLQSIVANRQSRWVEPDVLVLTNCSQTVPTGVQRIGTLSNAVAQIGTGFAASYGGTGSDGLAAAKPPRRFEMTHATRPNRESRKAPNAQPTHAWMIQPFGTSPLATS